MNKFSVLNMGRLTTPYGGDGEDREVIANRWRKKQLENYKVFLEELKGGKVEMKRKFEHGVRYPDGSGIPLMPKEKWNADGTPSFEHLNDDSGGRRDMVDNVRKYLVNKFGQAEGITRLKIMSAEEVFKLQDNINREFFNNAPIGSAYICAPKERWNADGSPDFSHLLEVAGDEDNISTKVEDSFEEVRKQLHIWFGVTQGEERFRSSTFEELQKMLENINDGKQLFAS